MSQVPAELDLPAGEASASPLGIVGIAWRRKSLVLLCGALGLLVGTLYYSQQPVVFQSSSRLLINKKVPSWMGVSGPAARQWFAEDYLAEEQEVLKSEALIAEAMKKRKLETLKTFANDPNPVGTIINGLAVNRDSKSVTGSTTNILYITFDGPVPEDCPVVLAAVTETYKGFLSERSLASSKVMGDLIKQASDIIEKPLAKIRRDLLELQLKNPLLVKNKDGNSLQRENMNNVAREKNSLQTRLVQLRVRREALESKLKAGVDPAEILQDLLALDVDAEPDKDGAGPKTELDKQIWPLRLELAKKEVKFGADHPVVKALRREMQLIMEHHQELTGKVVKAAPKKMDPELTGARKKVEEYLILLRQKISHYQAELIATQTLYDQEVESLKDSAKYEALLDQLQRKQTHLEGLSHVITMQLTSQPLTKDFGGYDARVISPPVLGHQIAPRAAPIFLMSLAGGLLLGLGLAWLAEVTDKSFKNPEEIRRRLGLPVLGHVPLIVPDPAAMSRAVEEGHALDPSLCAYYRSKSVQAEAFRGVRTWLYFNTAGKAHRVLQITSPNMGDGKSTVAANLAVSIAQSGKSILLIDADFRRPRQHKLFGLSGDVGLASVMAEETELEEAIQATAVENLAILPCGPRPANPAELLTAPRFKELLDTLGERYDFVLVDTPPLLVVSDPGVVAPRVDGVLLTIRVSKNGRPDAERAKESLGALNAKLLGVIVNGVGARGKYGYGKSYYNYQYAYSYAYKYRSFEDYSDEGYYQEEDDAAAANGNGTPRPSQRNGTSEMEIPREAKLGLNGDANSHHEPGNQ
jgi:capsular exopolysaccharide synthesis family protein